MIHSLFSGRLSGLSALLRPCALALLPVAATASLPGPTAAQTAPSDLDQIARHLRAVSTMTAAFTQTDRAGQSLTGTLLLKRPGRIRFEYQRGVPMLIVADGRSLNMIDYEVKQVQRWPVASSPLQALLDPNADIARYGRIVQTGDARVISAEVRDPRHPEYGAITLVFIRDAGAPGGLKLAGWTAIDAQNKRTAVKLRDQRFNVPVADSAFSWTDPRKR